MKILASIGVLALIAGWEFLVMHHVPMIFISAVIMFFVSMAIIWDLE